MHDLTLTQSAFSDAELVTRSRHGDDAAFEILADRHRPALHRALRALGGSPDLIVVAMPCGLLMLPALAWWLDRRRNRSGRASAR